MKYIAHLLVIYFACLAIADESIVASEQPTIHHSSPVSSSEEVAANHNGDLQGDELEEEGEKIIDPELKPLEADQAQHEIPSVKHEKKSQSVTPSHDELETLAEGHVVKTKEEKVLDPKENESSGDESSGDEDDDVDDGEDDRGEKEEEDFMRATYGYLDGFKEGSLCSYCKYCNNCEMCRKCYTCKKSGPGGDHCEACQYCKYCRLCDYLCVPLCYPGSHLDLFTGAIYSALPNFSDMAKSAGDKVDDAKDFIKEYL